MVAAPLLVGSIPGPSRAQGAAEAGTFASGALGAVLLAAAALLLAPSPARAGDNACGALSSNAATCSDQAYSDGISYDGDTSPVSVTIPGGSSTTITSANNNGWWSAVVVRTPAHASADRSIDINVGTTGAVAIRQGSNTSTNAFYNHMGVMAIQRAAGTIDIDVGSNVTIGTSTARMRQHGIYAVLAGSSSPTIAGAMTITSGATIYAGFDSSNTGHGIYLANAGPGASTVTNTGAIDATDRGIFVDDFGPTGAVTITSSGAITAAGTGIRAEARGTGKDAAGANAGVSITHTAGAITSSGAPGIQAFVGTDRQEGNTGHASYVAPMNTGLVKVEVTGGSISASSDAILAINFEAGGVDVDVAAGLTSSAGSGIYAWLTDAGNTSGAMDIDNAGEITAVTGIRVRQSSTANTVSITVDNDGALKKTGSGTGDGIRVQQSGSGAVTIDNTGAIGDATTQPGHGIRLENSGAGDSTVTNSGAIRASQRGILVEDTGSGGAISVTNSGDVTSSSVGIRAQSTGKDAAGANAGVSVTHTAGAISSSSDKGIQALVGTSRSEPDAMGGSYVAPMNTGLAKVEVTGGSISASSDAIEAKNFEAGGVDVDVSAGVTLTAANWHGIRAELTDVGNTAGNVDVDNAGTISAGGNGIYVLRQGAASTGSGAIRVDNDGAIRKTGTQTGYGIRVDNPGGSGGVTVDNSGAIGAANGQQYQRGIYLDDGGDGASTVANSGAVRATEQGILVEKKGTSGAVSVTTTGGSITSATSHGIHTQDNAGHTGDVTIANAGDVTAENVGIWVDKTGSAGAVSVTHSAGTVSAGTGAGIRARNAAGNPDDVTIRVTGGRVGSDGQIGGIRLTDRAPAVEAQQRGAGSATVRVSEGATLVSKHDPGILATLPAANAAGRIEVTQAGTIAGRSGVRATAARASAEGETRAATDQPLIDVVWTGTFAHGTGTAENDAARLVPGSGGVANAIAQHRGVQAEEATRYGAPAGIEARVLPWESVRQLVAGGNPSVDTATVRAALRDVLTDPVFDTIPGAAAIDTDGTEGLSDAEIGAYLTANSWIGGFLPAWSFTEAEKAVLRAVVTNTGLDAALAASGASNDWKAQVRGLLNRYNPGNIRIAVNGGSISSRGDGVRAYYVTPNAKNGAIDVTVAAGATVTGAEAGIYVANAGDGLMLARKYTSGYNEEDANPDELVAVMHGEGDDAVPLRNQLVTVHGTVTGGTDAAVHLSGGGAVLVMEGAKVHAGSSGRAILVNDPGPAIIYIAGEVKGAAGPEGDPAPAAVHLTGGGFVTVGVTGRVEANGADAAIRADGGATKVVVQTGGNRADAQGRPYREDADAAAERVVGGITDADRDGERVSVSFVPIDDEGMAGMETTVALNENDTLNVAALNLALAPCPTGQVRGDDGRQCVTPPPPPQEPDEPQTPQQPDDSQQPDEPQQPQQPDEPTTPTTKMNCDLASDGRCRLYEALPSALLAMNGLPTYVERMAAARDARGGWARVEAARGKWKADRSTRPNVAYDRSRTGVRAGADMAMGENARLGVSMHGLRGSADVTQGGGKVALTGVGVGVNGTAMAGNGVYIDAQAAVTRYDVELTSSTGRVLKDGAKGTGYALAVEAGRPMALEGGLSVTPRAGLAWSRVSLKDFRDSRLGTPVSVEDAGSLAGRVGVSVEKALDGDGLEDGSRLFGSLDVVQEFEEETEVAVMGTSLKASAEKTRLHTAVGGVRVWEEGRYTLQGSVGYTAGGSGNRDLGAGLSFSMRF